MTTSGWSKDMEGFKAARIKELVAQAYENKELMTKSLLFQLLRGKRGEIVRMVRELTLRGELRQETLPFDLYDALGLVGPRPAGLFPASGEPEEVFEVLRERLNSGDVSPGAE